MYITSDAVISNHKLLCMKACLVDLYFYNFITYNLFTDMITKDSKKNRHVYIKKLRFLEIRLFKHSLNTTSISSASEVCRVQ